MQESSRGVGAAAGVAAALVFVALTVAMNLYIKWLFAPWGGDFPLPWTMLAVQQLQAYCVLRPCLALYGRRLGEEEGEGEQPSASDSLQVLAVTCLFCLNVGLNALSLVRVSVTLNQTVRAFLPVGVLALASCLERRTYPWHAYATTAPLVLGIALTCWGSPGFEFWGFCCALGSTVVGAAGASLNGRLLGDGPRGRAGPARIIRLMTLQAVPATLIFGLLAGLTEATQLTALAAAGPWELCRILLLVSFSSALALLSNLGRCGLVSITSAVTETVAGNAKVAALCVIDNRLFGTVLHAHNYVGVALTLLSFSAHVLLQYGGALEEPAEDCAAEDAVAEAGGPWEPTRASRGRRAGPSRERRVPRTVSAAETGLAAEHLALLGAPRWSFEDGPAPERLGLGPWLADAAARVMSSRAGPEYEMMPEYEGAGGEADSEADGADSDSDGSVAVQRPRSPPPRWSTPGRSERAASLSRSPRETTPQKLLGALLRAAAPPPLGLPGEALCDEELAPLRPEGAAPPPEKVPPRRSDRRWFRIGGS